MIGGIVTPPSGTQSSTGPVDQTALRRGLAQFATGVVIVTAWDSVRREPTGMTINSFSSVSLDPPLVLFSIGRGAKSLEAWKRADAYGINVLGANHADLSDRFAKPLSAKWDGMAIKRGVMGTPLLNRALAWFECTAYRRYQGGDHVIFLAKVEYLEYGGAGRPLVFFRGRYTSVPPFDDADAESALAPEWPLPLHY